ncbi:hypothetical protein [Palleronia marisminoris]|uniref:hypothetical protein n=1 Tax=Palleronia marisminoris TaxID=315423 RepID=UPI00111351DD|nr:hypothetical protein [Palleronia marisminoris]
MAHQDPPAAVGARRYSDPDTGIVLHLGVHCTDDEKLIWSLRRDKGMLEGMNIAVPRRRFFTSILREFTTQRLKGARAGLADQEELFRRLIGTTRVERLVLSYDSFLGAPDRICADGTLYPQAGRKALDLHNLFPDNRIEFLCAVKNPVTFLADLYRRVDDGGSFDDFAERIDMSRFRWSDMIARIRDATPDVPITVWANEDTPLVWGDVLRAAAGVAPDHAMTGRFDVARSILTDEGCAAFDAYVAQMPPRDDRQAARVLEIFLDRTARPAEIEEPLTPSGLSDAAIDTLTRRYEEDLGRIASMPGVTFLAP